MKRNRAVVQLVVLQCPHCDKLMMNPSGSYDWAPVDVAPGGSVNCSECGKRSEFPARADWV